MRPGILAAISIIAAQGQQWAMDAGELETIHVPSYSWSGIGHVPFHFRTKNQRKRRKHRRQMGWRKSK